MVLIHTNNKNTVTNNISRPTTRMDTRSSNKWLQLTHDGDLKDLVDAFKQQKISGVTVVK